LVVDGDELLRAVRAEVRERVDCEAPKQTQRVWTGEEQVGHVVRLVEKGARAARGQLLAAPVGEFGRDGEYGRLRLRVPEVLDGAAGGGDGVGEGERGHAVTVRMRPRGPDVISASWKSRLSGAPLGARREVGERLRAPVDARVAVGTAHDGETVRRL